MEVSSQIGPFAKLSMLVSLVPCGVAIAHAIRPTERKLMFMRPASLATIFAAICAFCRRCRDGLPGAGVDPAGGH